MSDRPDLGPAVSSLLDIARGVEPSDLGRPTPNDGRSVSELIGHLVGLTAAFGAAAEKDFGEWTDTNPDEQGWPSAEDGWLATLRDRAHSLVTAWREPEAWTGMTRAGGVDLPGEVAGVVALDEVVLHGWDLATATGQEYSCDDATTQVLAEFVNGFDPAGTPGMFGPAVEAAHGTAFDRVLARSGRDPQWSA